MFRSILRTLGLAFTKVVPLLIIVMNLLYLDEGGWNLTLMGGLLAGVILYFFWIKPMNRKVEVWDIKGEYKLFVVNYRHLKFILLFAAVWWGWWNLHKDYQLVYDTLQYITISLVLGWLFTLLGLEYSVDEA